MEAGDGRWGRGAGGRPCLLELETDTRGEWHRMRGARRVTSFTSAQVINLCGPEKQVQSVDYLLPWLLHLPALLSALKCKIGPNSGLMHQAVRRQTLSLQSEKRLSGSGECFKFIRAGVSLCRVIIPQVQTKTSRWSPELMSRRRPGQRAAIRPGLTELTGA